MPRSHAAFLALCLVPTLGSAQEHAPCTGIVRDAEGVALSGAEVTFAFVSSIETPAPSDRVVVTSGADGRFEALLRGGDVYTVSAIGPVGADGARALALPRAEAAATWEIEVCCDARLERRRFQVSGTAPWIAEGPLSIHVTPQSVVRRTWWRAVPMRGFDVVIPGDGPCDLWVCSHGSSVFRLARADGTTAATLTAPGSDVLAFEPAATSEREIEVRVVDTDDRPIENAVIALAGRGRILATTDGRGEASIRIGDPSEQRRSILRASADGYDSVIAGWSRGQPLLSNAPEFEHGYLMFRLAPVVDPRTVRVLGLREPERASVWSRSPVFFRTQKGGGGFAEVDRSAIDRHGVALLPAASARPPYLRVHVPNDGVRERSLAVRPFGVPVDEGAADESTIDVGALATWRLQVVDAQGRAARLVQLGITTPGPGQPIPWLDRCALPSDGEISLRLPRSDLVVYAANGTSHGVALVDAGAEPGKLTIELQPFHEVTLRVRDGDGQPVRGAGFVMRRSYYHSPSVDPADKELDRIGADMASEFARVPRSDGEGLLALRLPLRDGFGLSGIVSAGSRKSQSVTLEPDAVIDVVVK